MTSDRAPAHQKRGRGAWKPGFLEAFRTYGTVTHACKAVSVGRRTVYDAREADEAFAAEWAAVEDDVSDDLEEEAVRRAKDGSDVLLIFLLKARRPQKYRENSHVTHAGALTLERILYADVDEALRAE
jgi:hypothetical protein